MALRKIFINNPRRPAKGFTLFEVLIVMAMLAVIASVTMFFSYYFYTQELLVAEKGNLILLLQSARAQAMQNQSQEKHGVAIDPQGYVGYVVFRGDSFQESNELFHLKVPRNTVFTFSSNTPQEIIFNQLSGESNNNITFTLKNSRSEASTTITINYEGAIY